MAKAMNMDRNEYDQNSDIDYAEPGAITKKPAGAGQPYPAHDPYRSDRYCQDLPGYGFMADKAHQGGGDTVYNLDRSNVLGDEYGTKDENDRWTGR